jgi:tetratricopeptide (TPR) repeat protein
MNDTAWARGKLRQATDDNLRFWSLQLAKGKVSSSEAANVLTAISFEQRLAHSRSRAAKVLTAAFSSGLHRQHNISWLQHYAALKPGAYPARLGCQLEWQHGFLLWQTGDLRAAQAAFARCEQRARKNGLTRLGLTASIGSCLCALASADLSKARKAAQRLKSNLASVRNRQAKAEICSAMGMVLFFERKYPEALAHFGQALELTDQWATRAQVHMISALCQLGLHNADAALQACNQAVRYQPRSGTSGQMARLELLRAAAHYAKSNRGQQVRLRQAGAALQRAAELLSETASDPAARGLLESYIGKVYTRAGDVSRGIEYLTSALELAEGAGNQLLIADLFASLQELGNKNPA